MTDQRQVLIPRPPTAGGMTRPTHDWRDVYATWLGRLVTLGGAVALIGYLLEHFLPVVRLGGLERPVIDFFGLVNLPVAGNLLTLVVLLALGGALRRRLRIAALGVLLWEIVVSVIQARTLLAMTGHGPALHDFPEVSALDLVLLGIAVSSGLVIAVVTTLALPAFPARLSRGNWGAAVTVLAAGTLAAYGVCVLLSLGGHRTLSGVREIVLWSAPATIGLNEIVELPLLRGHHGSRQVANVASTLTGLSVLASMLVFLRSARANQLLTPEDELRVRRMLLTDGERDSLSYFATREDKAIVYSPDGRSAITYRVEAAVALASGDPLGPPVAWPGAIEAWIAHARRHGWYVAALSASADGARAYERYGMKVITMGDEAILETDKFSLNGKAMRPVRHAAARLTRIGYTVQIRRDADIPADEMGRLRELAESWRGDATERGFSMALNRFGDPADGRCVTVLARNADGEVKGLLHFVPWGVRGLSLDLMRRDHGAENGITELMVSTLMTEAGEIGVRRVSLNFAMFRGIFAGAETVGASPLVKMSDRILSWGSRYFQLESLYRSNAKYLPTWAPRYLCYETGLVVARAALASGLAEGFVPSLTAWRARQGGAAQLSSGSAEEAEFLAAVQAQEDELLRPAMPVQRLTEQERVRRVKLARLVEAGMDPYPVSVPRDTTITAVRSQFGGLAPDARTGTVVSITGRIRARRRLGGVRFAVLQDGDQRLQVMLTRSETPALAWELWRAGIDLGDIVSVTGEVVASRTGELSVLVRDWTMASKCLRPVPRVLTDPEARARSRWVDLMVNEDSMRVLLSRSKAVTAIREWFTREGFVEVETPMLQATHGGANARPFRTHMNAYGMDLVLRIAPELFLKKLAVAGMPAIFEMNRSFRNEGADLTHNPEFTSCEAYLAYSDYRDMARITRECLLAAARAMHGREVAMRPVADGRLEAVDLSGEWPWVTVHEAVSRAVGEEVTTATPLTRLREICAQHGINAPREATCGSLVNELYEDLVEKQTTFPTFYTDFPVEVSPLAHVHPDDPALAEKWDLVAWGMEVGTAFSENTDPVYQRARFTEQSLAAAAGDPEAMSLDESFLNALEYALPPTGGLGFGVDRAVMMLAGTNIRPTLAFPFVRPESA